MNITVVTCYEGLAALTQYPVLQAGGGLGNEASTGHVSRPHPAALGWLGEMYNPMILHTIFSPTHHPSPYHTFHSFHYTHAPAHAHTPHTGCDALMPGPLVFIVTLFGVFEGFLFSLFTCIMFWTQIYAIFTDETVSGWGTGDYYGMI